MNMKKTVIFFGTGDFGADMLHALFNSGYQIDLVITQPDRPVGRKQVLTPPAVKTLALTLGLRVEQPESLKGYPLPEQRSELIVVCQYGLIIPKSVLEHAKSGAINVHTSLLPKYRGASPIQSALVNGETETGVTIMLMDEKMDHGPILRQSKVAIENNEKYSDLRKKMTGVASKLLIETLSDWLNHKIEPQIQNDQNATFCKIFTRDDGRINWQKSNQEIFNLYRGLDQWPGVWTTINDKRLKILRIEISDKNFSPGKLQFADTDIFAGCSTGSLKILELQLEGKRSMTAREFISGHADLNGAQLV